MLISKHYSVVTLLLIGVIEVLTGSKDGCVTSKENVRGTCKLFTECKSAIQGKEKGLLPGDYCGFVGTKPIVCCTDSPLGSRFSEANKMDSTIRETPMRPGEIGEKSARMCRKYADYAYGVPEDPSLAIYSRIFKKLECSFDKQTLIVGGTKASLQEFPHMAQIGYVTESGTDWECGGSLISEKFVLTTAHCIYIQQLGNPKLVRVGITNTSDTNYLQIRNVAQIIPHPGYTFQKYNDIALLKMDQNFEMNPYVRPACIYTLKNIPYQKAIASGWGRIEFSRRKSEDLLKVKLKFFSGENCNKTYRRDVNQPGSNLPRGIDDDLMICAGSSEAFRDTCQGDSGGPLQVYHEDTADIKCMYSIVGVTSCGKSCGIVKNAPGIYTRVSAYVNWIEDNVWPA